MNLFFRFGRSIRLAALIDAKPRIDKGRKVQEVAGKDSGI